MNTLDAIRTKRSVRKFTEESVPEETILQILDAGRHSQSSKNTQPWTFVLVQDKLKDLLGIPPGAAAEIGISFGYSAEEPRSLRKSGRKPLEDILKREHW